MKGGYLVSVVVYEVRSVRKLFNGEGLPGKPVYYHFLLVLPTLTALKLQPAGRRVPGY
jgi:hypothetical protein